MWDRNVMSIVIRRIFAAVAAAGPGAYQGWVFTTKKKKPGQAALSVSSPLQQFDKGRPLAATICPYYSNSQSVLQFQIIASAN